MVAGPPFIQSRMHERRRCGLVAASAAKAGSQPDRDPPSTPAVESFSQSRREMVGSVIGPPPDWGPQGDPVTLYAGREFAALHCIISPRGTPERRRIDS